MESQAGTGRVNQKQRTRSALLAAARHLLEQGALPTLQEIADEASVSRATAYRYYSDTEVLLMEAALDGIAAQVDRLHPGAGSPATELEGRLDLTVQGIVDMVLDNEALFRTYLRGVVAGDRRPERGGRRLRWIGDAIGADRSRFSKKLLERLVNALSLLTGIETVVVSRDVCGLDAAGTRELCLWTARAIIRAAIEEAAAARR